MLGRRLAGVILTRRSRVAAQLRRLQSIVFRRQAEMRGQFWEVVQRLSATLPDQDPNNQPDAFPGDPLGRRLPLKEHVELRGYVDVGFRQRLPMFG